MKTNRLKFTGRSTLISVSLFFTFLFVQCIGPEGPMGPRGYDGYDGEDGLNGISYSSSVIYDVDPSAWAGDVNGYDAVIDVPEITEDIYYNGAVLVYRLFETEPKTFNMLPYTYVDNALAVYFDFDAYVGSIDLMYKEVFDGVNDTPVIDNTMAFKVVIIEGIPLATVKTMVDVSDYSAVSKLFNIDSADKAVR